MAEGSGKIGQNIENLRIVVFDGAGTVVAQEMIELRFGTGGVFIAVAINNVEMLAGVRVIETNTMLG